LERRCIGLRGFQVRTPSPVVAQLLHTANLGWDRESRCANSRRIFWADGQTRTADRRFTKSREPRTNVRPLERSDPSGAAVYRAITPALLHGLLHW